MSTEKKAQRGEKRRQEEEKSRRANTLYTIIAVAVIVAAAAMMIWRSGIIQRNVTALTIDGAKYTAVEVQYYYNTLYSNHANSYDFLPNASVKEQVYDQETGQTWHDHLLEEAVEQMTTDTALAAKANSEGYTLSQDAQTSLDATLKQLDTIWIAYGATSRDAFIRSSFGPYMTYNKLVSLLELEYLSSDYATAQLDKVDHPDADYEAYYKDNADSLDTIVYSQLTFVASVATTDDLGNPIEMTDEEKAAALEKEKKAQKEMAEEAKAKLEAGEAPADLVEEYTDELYSSSVSQRSVGSSLAYSNYSDWLLDSARKTGDITLTENDSDTLCYYYVVLFEDRLRDEEATHSVRHILVRAGTGSEPTQEEYDAAEEQAKALLDEWKAGDATEDSFAVLAAANSGDSGSAANGGLISNITSTSSYVEAFRDWAVSSARKPGDTELVKTEYGWHVMYYSSTGEPTWRQTVATALNNQDYENLTAEVTQNCSVSRGTGMNFVSV